MDICTFLEKSYTAYHAVANSCFILEKNGFEQLFLDKEWNLETGGKYYVTKNDSTVIAFRIGSEFAFNVAISHTDSPCLKVKGNALVQTPEGARINVEEYGGLIHYSMLDAPLKVAGRVIEKHSDKLVTKLVESKYTVTIPSLAIHHNPTVNNGVAIGVQKDMLPLLGTADDLYSTLSQGEIVDADLYVVPALAPSYSGVNDEYLCSPRIDNLTSVYTSLQAIVECAPQNVAMACCFDNEEVGSRTKQGANSALLRNVLEKIARGLNKSKDDFISACENGFILSIDNGHAMHPAFPEKSDVTQKVYLNNGIVVKHHTNYATDGFSSAVVKTMLDKAGVEYQDYYNNSDLRCGSTIGLISGSDLSMDACDIGLAQLAMHSAVETVGAKDIDKMRLCVKTFFDSNIVRNEQKVTVK